MATLSQAQADLEARIQANYGVSATHVAEQYGVDPGLFLSLIQQESGGDNAVISSAGAVGLTQLMGPTARDLGVSRSDPLQNLEGGARYLKQMLDKFGNPLDALRGYNAGPAGATADPEAGLAYANSVLMGAGQNPYTSGPPVPPEQPQGTVDEWVAKAVAAGKEYGAMALVWGLVGLLTLFGVWALAMGKAAAGA